MNLRNKTIILISSERWGDIYISKHNYAIALAAVGNRVFFLNPIDSSLRAGEINLENSAVHPNLKVITYRPAFPMVFKFHFRYAFEILIGQSIRRLLRKLNIKPDIVWDFNCAYLYNDLCIFGAPLKIFSPVDPLSPDACSKKADVIISISDLILDQYAVKNVPKLRLNHGLGEVFARAAQNSITKSRNEILQVGYVGNLTLDSLDRDILLQVIKNNPDLTFNLVGPVGAKNNNLGVRSSEDDISSFIRELEQQKNVILHGARPQKDMPALLDKFDILLLCYKRTPTFKCDNSHKMIEYLSSGKVVVSTWLSVYAGSELVEMSREDKNRELPDLFKKVVDNIDIYNSDQMQRKRRAFALENTYESHISSIESFIEKLQPDTGA